MDQMPEWLKLVLSSGFGGTIVATISGWLLDRLGKRFDGMSQELADLKTKDLDAMKRKVEKVEEKFEDHVDKDLSQRVIAMLEAQGGTLNTLNAKFDRQAEITAAHTAKLDAHDLYIGNLDKSFENHKTAFHSGVKS